MKTKLMLLIIATFFTFSCSQDETIKLSQDNANKEVANFTYKGIEYSSSFIIENNDIRILDPKINEIYQTILDLPELAILVYSENKVEFFDNYQELTKAQTNNNLKNIKQTPNTRIITERQNWGTLELFKDANYTGRKLTFTFSTNNYEIGNLCDYDFNDDMSSFRIHNSKTNIYRVTFFADAFYQGRSISFSPGSADFYEVYYMGMRFSGSLWWQKDWNDTVTSFKIDTMPN